MGKFEEAHHDLTMACKLDYDDQSNAWLKEVEPNVSFNSLRKRTEFVGLSGNFKDAAAF